jgi:hypothetical protein
MPRRMRSPQRKSRVNGPHQPQIAKAVGLTVLSPLFVTAEEVVE